MKQTKKELRKEIEDLHETLNDAVQQMLKVTLIAAIMTGEILLAKKRMQEILKYIAAVSTTGNAVDPPKIETILQMTLHEMDELAAHAKEINDE